MTPETSSYYIQKIGTAVPSATLGPQQSADLFRQVCDPRTARMLPRIIRLTGIDQRHLGAMEPQFAPDGAEPLYRALSEQPRGPGMGARNGLFARIAGPLVVQALAEFPPARLAEIETLITASCTHASAPGLEWPIFSHTAVRPTVDRWNLGFMGCSAGVAALRLAQQTLALGRDTLIVACELSSLHFQYTSAVDQLTANLLFADGAAAVALSTRRAAARLVSCRCAALPEKAAQMVWFADDQGLRLELSQDLPDTLAAVLPGVVNGFLADNGLTQRDIDHWLVHPGGPQILDATEQSLALPATALRLSRNVLRRYGNMSSPTIFFILEELLNTRVDGRCMALAFGPGLTIELALLEINHGDL